MRDLYFKWLVGIIDGGRAKDRMLLLEQLFDTDFYWSIPGDRNRALDGLNLRRDFCYEYDNINDIWFDANECTVLEMMVAMAVRFEKSFMQDDERGDQSANWFWIMIENLELIDETDDIYDSLFVSRVIIDFLDRQYDADGRGSIFYVNRIRENMRRVELWYQMCWYFDEHYNFDIL